MQIRKISTRLFFSLVLCAVGFIALTLFASYEMRANLMAGKKEKVESVVDVAMSIATEYHNKFQKGEMTETEAQDHAKEAIRGMRFEGENYVFAYKPDGVCLIHGLKPEREGKNNLDNKDAKGDLYIRNIIDTAMSGKGFLSYYFAKAGQTEPLRKTSYAGYFKPWNWIFGAGVYTDDVEEQFQGIVIQFGSIVAVVLLLVSAITWLVSRTIAKPLEALANATVDISKGNYDTNVPAQTRADEIGRLAKSVKILCEEAKKAADLRHEQETAKARAEADRKQAMNALATKFETSVQAAVEAIGQRVHENEGTAGRMLGDAGHAREASAAVLTSAQNMTANIQTVASATEELSASIQEIASQMSQSSSVCTRAVGQARDSSGLIGALNQTVEKIGEVIKLITTIAEQTNLLALNATIEAARAGDAGKGFAVVAGEVKTLANQTARATDEIEAKIGEVRSATASVVKSIAEISTVIGQINDISTNVAAAVEEQSSATKEISRNLQEASMSANDVSRLAGELSQGSETVEKNAKNVSAATADLGRESAALSGEVDHFLKEVRQ